MTGICHRLQIAREFVLLCQERGNIFWSHMFRCLDTDGLPADHSASAVKVKTMRTESSSNALVSYVCHTVKAKVSVIMHRDIVNNAFVGRFSFLLTVCILLVAHKYVNSNNNV